MWVMRGWVGGECEGEHVRPRAPKESNEKGIEKREREAWIGSVLKAEKWSRGRDKRGDDGRPERVMFGLHWVLEIIPWTLAKRERERDVSVKIPHCGSLAPLAKGMARSGI